jgi:hypothetical protein
MNPLIDDSLQLIYTNEQLTLHVSKALCSATLGGAQGQKHWRMPIPRSADKAFSRMRSYRIILIHLTPFLKAKCTIVS